MSYDWQNSQFDPVILPGQSIGLHVLGAYVGTDIRAAAIAEVDGQQVFVSAANKGFRLGNPDDSDTNFHIMGLPFATFPTWQTATANINGPLGAPDQGKLGAAWDPVRGTIWWHIAFLTEPYIGNLDWTVTLTNAPANPLSAAFMFRGRAAAPPGLVVPGVINCGLLLSLANPLISEGTRPIVGGEASFVRTLPNDTGLLGAEAAFQWLLPTTVSVLPLDLSDAGALRVGTNL